MLEATPDRGLPLVLPRIKRARGFFLYGDDGRRYIDLWQGGGTAALGHTPNGFLSVVKNSASRGLYFPLPNAWIGRLERSLLRLFPTYRYHRFFGDPSLARTALAVASGMDPAAPLPDPAFADIPPSADRAIWRPWAPFPALDSADAPASLMPILPVPVGGVFSMLLFRDEQHAASTLSTPVSPMLAAAACHISDLLRLALELELCPDRSVESGSNQSHRTTTKIKSRLPTTATASLRSLDTADSPWRRRGIYAVYRRSGSQAYEQVFSRFLAAGFLLPPTPLEPAILPDELSPGSDAALAALFIGEKV